MKKDKDEKSILNKSENKGFKEILSGALSTFLVNLKKIKEKESSQSIS